MQFDVDEEVHVKSGDMIGFMKLNDSFPISYVFHPLQNVDIWYHSIDFLQDYPQIDEIIDFEEMGFPYRFSVTVRFWADIASSDVLKTLQSTDTSAADKAAPKIAKQSDVNGKTWSASSKRKVDGDMKYVYNNLTEEIDVNEDNEDVDFNKTEDFIEHSDSEANAITGKDRKVQEYGPKFGAGNSSKSLIDLEAHPASQDRNQGNSFSELQGNVTVTSTSVSYEHGDTEIHHKSNHENMVSSSMNPAINLRPDSQPGAPTSAESYSGASSAKFIASDTTTTTSASVGSTAGTSSYSQTSSSKFTSSARDAFATEVNTIKSTAAKSISNKGETEFPVTSPVKYQMNTSTATMQPASNNNLKGHDDLNPASSNSQQESPKPSQQQSTSRKNNST